MNEQVNNIYVAIDLKSFYASVECKERKLDPMTTNLVVADSSRTEKTICLAVSPSLKSYGIPGRARLFEVIQKVNQVNAERKRRIKNHEFSGSSCNNIELQKNPYLKLDYIIAPPRMAYYMKYSTDIYNIYLKYFSSDDVFAYSIDEVFCNITPYLHTYKMTAKELVTKVLQEVYKETGITATAGIGTNLYLSKIAMDIGAKHVQPNEFGVRIAELDEMKYRKLLWDHMPITDFWRIGGGYAKKLEEYRIFTMGDVARTSINNEELLYKLFGINAELLIDHSWGWEPCTIEQIKSYKPTSNSISSGQVLHCPYDYDKAKIIVKEMVELLTLDLVEKHVVTSQIVLTIGYDVNVNPNYKGEFVVDRYKRKIPKHARGTANLKYKTASTKLIMEATMNLYERIVNSELLIRRINITANNVINEELLSKENTFEQINLFEDYKQQEKQKVHEQKEKSLQKTVIDIKKKFGKNAILKGMNLQEEGTTIERNGLIGGHKE